MPKRRFSALRQRLLDEGIASRFADRIEIELHDHFCDLEQEAAFHGRTGARGRREALRRIGSDEAIVTAFMERPELQCWIYRSRIAWCVLRTLIAGALASRDLICTHALRTAARYSCAGVAGTFVTSGLLLALSLSLEPALFDEIGQPVTASRDGRHRPAARRNLRSTEAHANAAGPAGSRERRQPVQRSGMMRMGARSVSVRLGDIARVKAPAHAAALLVGRAEIPARPALADASPPVVRPRVPDPSVELPARPFGLPDSDYLPIVKVSPVYPPRAAARGIEGYVVIEYTVTPAGTVSDIVVIESSSPLFERSALEAAAKFKYKPRVVGGESVAVSGVRAIIRFELDA
jgi:TonB family protein